ncbi:MAG TPA: imidazole glycerol phosphate synthase subunit HisH [Cyclobacteriaceae bacterium]|nr:imidazole glycerol phosphate synthase subunit HisH [Cyclobacteriaceae bacterium]
MTIIDYGVGNLGSIKNMLKKIGVESLISSDVHDVEKADKLILPGVGAFDTCAEKLSTSGLLPALIKRVQEDKVPVLGICVGMQMLMEGSEEGVLPGLGWIKGRIVRFRQDMMPADFKVPHMGWTEVKICKPSKLFQGMYDEPRFYFVHSYHPQVIHAEDALIEADYGYKFVGALERDNVIGVQFHPEKSHKFGMKLLENFVKLY